MAKKCAALVLIASALFLASCVSISEARWSPIHHIIPIQDDNVDQPAQHDSSAPSPPVMATSFSVNVTVTINEASVEAAFLRQDSSLEKFFFNASVRHPSQVWSATLFWFKVPKKGWSIQAIVNHKSCVKQPTPGMWRSFFNTTGMTFQGSCQVGGVPGQQWKRALAVPILLCVDTRQGKNVPLSMAIGVEVWTFNEWQPGAQDDATFAPPSYCPPENAGSAAL